MTIILLIFFLFIVITSRYKKHNEEYLSKEYTNKIKGIFLFFVFISHFISYKIVLSKGIVDTVGVKFIKTLGQLMVTMFLFYSGYGIMASSEKENYVKNMPRKRILSTLINFDFAVIIYMIASKYFITHKFSIKKLGLALIGWDGFGNSNWYIFCILVLYIISYLSLKSFKSKKHALLSMYIGTALYTIILTFYKESWWYNTAFCFVLGSTYYVYRDKIEKFLTGRELLSFVYTIAIFIVTYHLRKSLIMYIVNTMSFVLIIVLLTRKINIKNALLYWMGKNLFPLYIFQRLPMMFLVNYEYMRNNPYVFFGLVLVSTAVIACLYNLIMFIIKKCISKISSLCKDISKGEIAQ